MKIVTVRDKRLKALVEDPALTSVKGLDKMQAKRIADMIVAINAMASPLQLIDVPGWNAHELTPRYPGKWSLRVTGNYRLTFMVDEEAGEVRDLDFVDYH